MSQPEIHNPEWITRAEIDAALEQLSASDLIEAVGDGTRQGAKVAGAAFDAVAARTGLSNGSPATQHIRAADFKYLADRLGEVINVDSPLSDETSDLLASAEHGD